MNTQLAPYNDPRVRRAMSLSIDRDKIDEIVYEGAQIATIYPFPLYPNLQAFVDSPEVQGAVEDKYSPRTFDLDAERQLMTEAGFTKNGDGLWEKDGETVNCTIHGFEGIHCDIVPVLVEMLRPGVSMPRSTSAPMPTRTWPTASPGLYMFGHGASLMDPYAAFELFHGRYSEADRHHRRQQPLLALHEPRVRRDPGRDGPAGADDPKSSRKLLSRRWRSTGGI